MRAIEAQTFSGYGGLPQGELPKPQPAKSRVLVRVTAAGVTPLDYTILSGGVVVHRDLMVLSGGMSSGEDALSVEILVEKVPAGVRSGSERRADPVAQQ